MRAFWDAHADSLLGTEWAVSEFAASLAAHAAGKHVLELGCGGGQLSLLLASIGAHLTVVDFSPAALAAARARFESARLAVDVREADIVGLALGKRFDLICGSAVLHEVQPARFPTLLDTLADHMAPGGACVFLENSGFNPLYVLARNHVVGRFGLRKVGSDQEQPFDRRRWTQIVNRFQIAERRAEIFLLFDRAWYQFAHPIAMRASPRLATSIGRRFTRLDKYLGRRFGDTRITRYWSWLQTLHFSEPRR